MRKLSIISLFLLTAVITSAQSKRIDTLRTSLNKQGAQDTVLLDIFKGLSNEYYISKPDSSLFFGQKAYDLAMKLKRTADQAVALTDMANAYATEGDYVKSFQLYFKAIKVYESINYLPGVVLQYNDIGATYIQKEDYLNALPYLQLGLKKWNAYSRTHKLVTYDEKRLRNVLLINIAEDFLYTHKIDSADHYLQILYSGVNKIPMKGLLDNLDRDIGEVETARGHKAAALKYYREAVSLSLANENVEMLSITYLSIANLYHKYKQQDSAEYYAQKALETAAAQKYLQDVLNAGKILYTYYEEDHNLPQAYKYLKITTATKDSLFSQDKVKQLLSMAFDEKQRMRDIEQAQMQVRNNIRMYLLIAGIIVLLVLAIIFWFANKQRKKAYNLLHQQKEEIDHQKAKVEHTLGELKSTQTQLIQAEKMASLGELTAGIAHEIQNPLNFVNNFSEVNQEMLVELDEELNKGDIAEAKAIAADIRKNEQKINHHGRRADSIVKGMLEHSRSASGQKEPTDINQLADEYLRLIYHGLRAKDKNFNAELVTNFDPALPKVNAIPQDIGRVLLNLFNNAFYAINQKQKAAAGSYKPEVSITTTSENGSVVIMVKDNGSGIPESIKEKIMQPFFTTKPTGEGTGLGLSLTYDMVVKGHSGSIQVNSTEGEGSEFIIILPSNLKS